MTTQVQSKTSKNLRHLGKRPKNDQDNHCREKLGQLVRDVGCFYEIAAEKLYMVCLARDEDATTFCDHSQDVNCPFIFWSLYDSPDLTYEPFNMDFGPFNLATTHQFISRLKIWFDTQPYRGSDKYVVVVLDDLDTERKLNATLSVAISAMVLLNMTAQEVIQRLDFFMMPKPLSGKVAKSLSFRQKTEFSDVSGNHSLMRLTLEDCIHAFYAAIQNKFYSFYDFDHAEYLFYETVMSGDLNWIIPNKILAFAGPSDKINNSKLYHKHPPSFYHDYFNDHNVTTIIRLNEAEYDKSGFQDHGFDHHDLIFPDGFPPTSPIAARFIKIVDEAKGAVAVHCYAGIGRTGTLIAAYLMARYNFTSQMAVAWTRICRPGSVIGEQQDWLFTKFDQYSVAKSSSKPNKSKKVDASNTDAKQTQSFKTNYEFAEQTLGQARALVLAKKQRENSDKPCTRNSLLQRNTAGAIVPKGNVTKRVDVVLDLGKTIPTQLSYADFMNCKEGENPKFYRIKDSKYEWKVKFPEPGYVTLQYDREKDLKAATSFSVDLERVVREPILDFRFKQIEVTSDEKSTQEDGLKMVPKMKPVVYFSLVSCF